MRILHGPSTPPVPYPASPPAPVSLEELLARQRLAREMRDEAVAAWLRRGWRLLRRLLAGPAAGSTRLPALRADRL